MYGIELFNFIQRYESRRWRHGECRGVQPVGNDAVFEIGKDGMKYLSPLTRLAAERVAWSNQKPWSVPCCLKLVDSSAQAPTTLTIPGDILPTDTNLAKDGIQAAGNAQGNLIGTAGPYSDIIFGSVGNDHIVLGELDDDSAGGTSKRGQAPMAQSKRGQAPMALRAANNRTWRMAA